MKLAKKLFDGVYLLQGESMGRPLVLPLLVGKWQRILLDTGTAADVKKLILPALKEIGLKPADLTFVINTHCDLDHQGGNHGVKRLAPRALLACGDADREEIESPEALWRLRYDAYRKEHGVYYDAPTKRALWPTMGRAQPVDLTLRGGERIRLAKDWEVRILHLPGHSRGHLGVWDLKNRALYAGDAMHGAVYRDFQGHAALCPTYLHIEPYRNTIRFIESLPIATYCGCHWPVKRGDEIRAFCEETRRFAQQAEELILATLPAAGRGKTMRDLFDELGPRLGDWPRAADSQLRFAFGGHLRDLADKGLIRKQDGGAPFRYLRRTR